MSQSEHSESQEHSSSSEASDAAPVVPVETVGADASLFATAPASSADAVAPQKTAIKATKSEEEHPVRGLRVPERTLLICNLPATISRTKVQTLCQSFGTIEAIYLRGATLVANEAFKESSRSARRMAVAAGKIDPNGTVMANVRFAAASEALAAAEAITGQQIEGRFVRASLATQKEFPKDRTLFIGSVPNVLTEDQLFMVLKQAGVPVAAVRIPISKETGRARGVAFALMPSREAVAEAARKTVKIDVDGEEKKLLLARPLDKKKLAKRADKRQTALGRKGRQDKRAAAKGKVPAKSD